MVTLPPWFYTTSSDNRLCHTIEFLYNTEDEECRHKADAPAAGSPMFSF